MDMVFTVVKYGCESWTIKKAECQEIDAFELWYWGRVLRVPWTARKSIQGNQSWIFIWRTDAEAEAPMLWPPDVKNWLNRKDYDAAKDWRQEERGMTEVEMVEWHHQLNGHECEQTLWLMMDREAWNAAIHEVTKSRTWLSDWTKLKTDSDFPGGVSSKEPAWQCIRHKRHGFFPWVRKIPWRKAWQPTPVFLPAESPWTEEPGRLQFIGFQRVRQD